MIKASKLVPIKVECWSLTLSLRLSIDVYIDNLLPHASLELCSYWGCGHGNIQLLLLVVQSDKERT